MRIVDGWMDEYSRWMDEYSRWMDGQIFGQMVWMDRQIDGCIDDDGWMDELMTSVYMDGQLGVKYIKILSSSIIETVTVDT